MIPHHFPNLKPSSSHDLYSYPDHLREQVSAAASTHGIYIFHGRANDFPLYIGKSVNLRSRLLAHLRNKNEARLLNQTAKISFIQTAGEITSLLLEAKMIKEHKPLFNRRLRKLREVFSYVLDGSKLTISPSAKNQYGHSDQIYGLFKSKSLATQKIRTIADEHQLCLAALGIDPHYSGQACFRHSIKKCAGACCGKEDEQLHYQRLVSALTKYKIALWPYQGRIALLEQNEEFKEFHIMDHWHYLGSYQTLEYANRQSRTHSSAFDADMYKILIKPILTNSASIIELD